MAAGIGVSIANAFLCCRAARSVRATAHHSAAAAAARVEGAAVGALSTATTAAASAAAEPSACRDPEAVIASLLPNQFHLVFSTGKPVEVLIGYLAYDQRDVELFLLKIYCPYYSRGSLTIRSREEADVMFRSFPEDCFKRAIPVPLIGVRYKSIAQIAFCDGNPDLASYFLERGGSAEGLKVELSGKPSLNFEFPVLSQELRRCFLERAKERGNPLYIQQDLSHALLMACEIGSVEGVEWVNEKARENGIVLPREEITDALKRAIALGFEKIVDCILPPDFPADQRGPLIDLAISLGHLHLLPQLTCPSCPLTPKQEQEVAHFQAVLAMVNRIPDLGPPLPINDTHGAIHGGDANWKLYVQEYRRGVAVLLHNMRPGCNFEKIIEMAGGDIRRRQAILGGLRDLDRYGVPPWGGRALTYFQPGSTYEKYGRKIAAMYSKFPVDIIKEIRGKKYRTSTIYKDHWEHPTGSGDRGVFLSHLAECAQRIYSDNPGSAPTETEIRTVFCAFGRFIHDTAVWPLSARGHPTSWRMVVDALLISIGLTPLSNFEKRTDASAPPEPIDWNCEALCQLTAWEFTRDILLKKAPLPKPIRFELFICR